MIMFGITDHNFSNQMYFRQTNSVCPDPYTQQEKMEKRERDNPRTAV